MLYFVVIRVYITCAASACVALKQGMKVGQTEVGLA
jgi:hypothetical protein